MKLIVSKTFQVVTQESAEQGDFAESGFVYKDKKMTLKDLILEFQAMGCMEWSSSDPAPGNWLAETDGQQDLYDGSYTYESLHFTDGLTAHQAKRIIRIVNQVLGVN